MWKLWEAEEVQKRLFTSGLPPKQLSHGEPNTELGREKTEKMGFLRVILRQKQVGGEKKVE